VAQAALAREHQRAPARGHQAQAVFALREEEPTVGVGREGGPRRERERDLGGVGGVEGAERVRPVACQHAREGRVGQPRLGWPGDKPDAVVQRQERVALRPIHQPKPRHPTQIQVPQAHANPRRHHPHPIFAVAHNTQPHRGRIALNPSRREQHRSLPRREHQQGVPPDIHQRLPPKGGGS
jgi:hypothetical protein